MTTSVRQTAPRTGGSGDINQAPVGVSGIFDARTGQAFLRTSGYRRGRDDVHVPAACLIRYGLRTGDRVEGTARPRRAAGKTSRPGRLAPRAPKTSSTR